jgi:hypothetical protein
MYVGRMLATGVLLTSVVIFLASIGVAFESRAYAIFCPGPTCQDGCHYMSLDVNLSSTTCLVISGNAFNPAQAIWGWAPGPRASNKKPKDVPGQFVQWQQCGSGAPACGGNGPMAATSVWNCTLPGNLQKTICPLK